MNGGRQRVTTTSDGFQAGHCGIQQPREAVMKAHGCSNDGTIAVDAALGGTHEDAAVSATEGDESTSGGSLA